MKGSNILGGIPDGLVSVWEGQEELASWNCDLCNQQAPSHSKHAISPQTEACFSITHGFNWRLLPLLLLCLQLRGGEKRASHTVAQQTWLWNQQLADKSSWQWPLDCQNKRWLYAFLFGVFVYLNVYFCLWANRLAFKLPPMSNKASCFVHSWLKKVNMRQPRPIKGSFIWFLTKMVLDVCCNCLDPDRNSLWQMHGHAGRTEGNHTAVRT